METKSTKKETSELRKFRVVAGVHVQGEKSYEKGKVVKSEKDLVKLFPGKFTEVGGRSGDEDEIKSTAPRNKSQNEGGTEE